MRTPLLVLAALLMTAESGAQVIRRGNLGASPPAVWVSGGVAYSQGFTVSDGTTGTRWDFGNGTLYQAALEKALAGVSFGLRGTTGLVPLRYTPLAGNTTTAATDADARVSQLFATFHAAGDRGFHSVVELSAGATHFSGFRARASGTTLAPTSDDDLTLAFGYGFGYGVSNRFAVEVVQDVALVMHQRTGLGGGEDASSRMHTTRIVGRLGLGERR